MRKFFALSILLALFAATYWLRPKPSHDVAELAARASAQNGEAVDAQAPALNASVTAGTAGHRAPTSIAPSSSSAGAASSAPALGLNALLAKYSANRSWAIERDPNGNPMRMSGQGLRVMGGGPEANAFLTELSRELGFKAPPVLELQSSRTANFKVEDYLESYQFSNGEKLPVYDAWLRLKGNESDGAYVVVNLLKVVDDSIQQQAQLSNEEAIAILRRELELKPDSTLTVRPAPVVFADQAPHQKALEIDVGGPQPHWLVLVGFETHTVVYKRITSHN